MSPRPPVRASHNIIPSSASSSTSTSSNRSTNPSSTSGLISTDNTTLNAITSSGYDGEEMDIMLNAATAATNNNINNNNILDDDEDYEIVEQSIENESTQQEYRAAPSSSTSSYSSTSTTNRNQQASHQVTEQNIEDDLNAFIHHLENHFDQYAILRRWSHTLGIKGSYIGVIVALISLILTAKLAGAVAVIHTSIWLYGSYHTYKCLAYVAQHQQSSAASSSQASSSSSSSSFDFNIYPSNDPTNVTQPLLMYWSMYMLYKTVEQVTDILFINILGWSTLYTLTKVIVLVTLMLPPVNAYKYLYNTIVSKLFDRYDTAIQQHSSDVLISSLQVVKEVQDILFRSIGEYLRSSRSSSSSNKT
jgi:hypothetical protein